MLPNALGTTLRRPMTSAATQATAACSATLAMERVSQTAFRAPRAMAMGEWCAADTATTTMATALRMTTRARWSATMATQNTDDVECDGGMVPCGRCGRTGVDPLAGRVVDPWESDSCRDCSGDGHVTCPGCGECGKGDGEVFDV